MRTSLRILLLAALASAMPVCAQEEEDADPAEVAIGERLFLETRFAQYFAANAGGDLNAALATGDPVVATTATAVHFRGRSPVDR